MLQKQRQKQKQWERRRLTSWIIGKTIKHHYSKDYSGCSAEGHISHIYSDRLSSRPLGWSRDGIDQMARLRVFAANGGNLFDLALRKKQERIRETKIIELDLKVCRKDEESQWRNNRQSSCSEFREAYSTGISIARTQRHLIQSFNYELQCFIFPSTTWRDHHMKPRVIWHF